MPENQPEFVRVPSIKFFMLDGKGNPNRGEFAKAIGILYSLSYAVKMLPKKGITPSRGKGSGEAGQRQPDFVSDKIAGEVRKVQSRKNIPAA